MTPDVSFIAIDVETATPRNSSICEVGICVVIHGHIIETRSWLVRPEHNRYFWRNVQVHGIRPEDTEDAPQFDEVWEEIERLYLDDIDLLVAHNAGFDRGCLLSCAKLHNVHMPPLKWDCTLARSRRLYPFTRHGLTHLCEALGIRVGRHHRAGDDAEMCARIYLRELADLSAASGSVEVE